MVLRRAVSAHSWTLVTQHNSCCCLGRAWGCEQWRLIVHPDSEPFYFWVATEPILAPTQVLLLPKVIFANTWILLLKTSSTPCKSDPILPEAVLTIFLSLPAPSSCVRELPSLAYSNAKVPARGARWHQDSARAKWNNLVQTPARSEAGVQSLHLLCSLAPVSPKQLDVWLSRLEIILLTFPYRYHCPVSISHPNPSMYFWSYPEYPKRLGDHAGRALQE
jgi:hypothetical protein